MKNPSPENNPSATESATLELQRENGSRRLKLALAGSWTLEWSAPQIDRVGQELGATPEVRQVIIDATRLEKWDSRLLIFLRKLEDLCQKRQITLDKSGLPKGARRLLELAEAMPERQDAHKSPHKPSFAYRVGETVLGIHAGWRLTLTFFGEVTLSLLRFLRGAARFRGSDLLLFTQDAGVNALPLITLISTLVGLILAFVGAVQLQLFGAEIFIADAVGLGMARDMGAMMTGIIMAGRTGASYAAQLGTMQVNEEIDALRTFGVPPIDFLVLPRVLALTFMLPLLTVYADLMGMLGGALVGIGLFDITPSQYYHQSVKGVPLVHFGVGLVKSVVYGIIVAISGCLRGIHCGRSASAVGQATTSAVVTAIVGIVISCAILTVMFHMIGI